MRRLFIIENRVGAVSQYVVETSDGKRGVGASLASALDKVAPVGVSVVGGIGGLAAVFNAIRDAGGTDQIHKGVQW